MKKSYTSPTLEFTEINKEDIITTSPANDDELPFIPTGRSIDINGSDRME